MRKFALTLDDLSPYPRAGLGFESIVWCDKVIEKYPDFKVNLFVPAAYCRLGEKPCYLHDYPEWVKRINNLPTSNYRINAHGLFHRRTAKDLIDHVGKPKSNNDEWQYLTDKQAKEMFIEMLNIFHASGLNYYGWDWGKTTFRPPGWKISKEAVVGIQQYVHCFAGSMEYYEKVKDVLEVKWINYNWDMISPCNVDGDVVAFGHTSEWTNNYMNRERYNLIVDLLDSDEFEFRFVEDM